MVLPNALLNFSKFTCSFSITVSNSDAGGDVSKFSKKKFNPPVCSLCFLSAYRSLISIKSLSVGFFSARASVIAATSSKCKILFPTHLCTCLIAPFDMFGNLDWRNSCTSASFKSFTGTECDLSSPMLVVKLRAVYAEDSTTMNYASLESVPHDFNCTRSCCSWSEVNFTLTSSTIIGSCFTRLSAWGGQSSLWNRDTGGFGWWPRLWELLNQQFWVQALKSRFPLVMSAVLTLANNAGLLFSFGWLTAIHTAVDFPEPQGSCTTIVGK